MARYAALICVRGLANGRTLLTLHAGPISFVHSALPLLSSEIDAADCYVRIPLVLCCLCGLLPFFNNKQCSGFALFF